jgi:hypothetical protein
MTSNYEQYTGYPDCQPVVSETPFSDLFKTNTWDDAEIVLFCNKIEEALGKQVTKVSTIVKPSTAKSSFQASNIQGSSFQSSNIPPHSPEYEPSAPKDFHYDSKKHEESILRKEKRQKVQPIIVNPTPIIYNTIQNSNSSSSSSSSSSSCATSSPISTFKPTTNSSTSEKKKKDEEEKEEDSKFGMFFAGVLVSGAVVSGVGYILSHDFKRLQSLNAANRKLKSLELHEDLAQSQIQKSEKVEKVLKIMNAWRRVSQTTRTEICRTMFNKGKFKSLDF